MEHEINIPTSATKSETYDLLLKQVDILIENEDNLIANLANTTSVLKHSLNNVIWAGYYLFDDKKNELVLGPFQGKLACTRINFGKGVCGTAIETKESIVVDDVEKFPGHIYCDSNSRSEIVIPIIVDGSIRGVLDIDSDIPGNFDETDKQYLEQIVDKIKHLFLA